MELIKDKVKNLHTCMQFLHDGIVQHQSRREFKINNRFYFRTVYIEPDVLDHLEGDAGVCALQEIFNRRLFVTDFFGANTAAHGCNPVMMLATVLKHDYDDTLRFLMCIAIACKGDMTAIINYLYPKGMPLKKGVAVDPTYIKFPMFYIRENGIDYQIELLKKYIVYLKTIEV